MPLTDLERELFGMGSEPEEANVTQAAPLGTEANPESN